MRTFTFEDLHKKSLNRPKWYMEEVLLSSKKIDDNTFYLPREEFLRIREKLNNDPRYKASLMPKVPVIKQHKTPGDMLAFMIKEATGDSNTGCAPCDHRRKEMNEWGWAKCLTVKMPTIIGWLQDERKKRGLPISKTVCVKAIKAAVKYLKS